MNFIDENIVSIKLRRINIILSVVSIKIFFIFFLILVIKVTFCSNNSAASFLEIYPLSPNNLPNKFLLRGLPTTIFIDKNGLEFARAVGSIDFQNEKFINWLKKYD